MLEHTRLSTSAFYVGAMLNLVCLLIPTGQALAEETHSEGSGSMHLRTASGREIRNAPRLHTDVTMQINGLLARVSLEQHFLNPSEEWVEAVYVFPLPADSAVDHMRMKVGEHVIEGEIQEKALARRTYEKAKRVGQSTSLLQQQRPNIFTSAVANVAPGEKIEVQIEYQQTVELSAGLFFLRFPMVVGPRYIPGEPISPEPTPPGPMPIEPIEEQLGRFNVEGWAEPTGQVPDAHDITPPVIAGGQNYDNPIRLDIRLDVGMPLREVTSAYHKIVSQHQGVGKRYITLSNKQTPANRDFVLQWRLDIENLPRAALFNEQWINDSYSMLMLVPPAARQRAAMTAPARELILVVDTSGSMHGESIEQARSALQLALAQLRPHDRFNLIQFNSGFESLHPHAVYADPETVQQALRYVDRLQADGGTEMLPAMRHALNQSSDSGALRQLVFLTDGDIGNEQALFETIEQHLGKTRLFPVGIGSAPNGYFMRRAAQFGRGSYTFIGDIGEVRQKMQALFEQLAAPVLTDVQVEWENAEGDPLQPCEEQVVERSADVYAGEPMWLVHCASQAPHQVVVSGLLGRQPWRTTVQLQGGSNAVGLHVLWARKQIAEWMAKRTLQLDPEVSRSKIVSLGLAHHLVTDHTSLVAVDKTPRRPLEEPLHSKPVPTLLPQGWSRKHVFGNLPQTGTDAQLKMLLGVMMLMLGWLVFRRRWA